MSNLLSPQEKKGIVRMYRKRFLSLVFFSVIVLFAAGSVLLFPSLFFLKTNESVLTQNKIILESRETTKIAATLATTIADINTHLNVFPDSAPASPFIASFIDPVLKLKTPAVHITDFSYATGSTGGEVAVQISGTTDTRSDLLTFADTLKTTPGFKDVLVPIASFIKDSNVTFTVSATVVLSK